MMRVHTAGSVGGSTALVAASLVQAGIHERVLTVAFEKQSESDAMWALSRPLPFAPPTLAGAGGYFAPLIRAYIRRSGAPEQHRHDGRGEGPAERAEEPVRAPAPRGHQHREGGRVADAVGPDPLPRDVPVVRRRLRDGLADEAGGDRAAKPPAWVHGTAMRSEPTMFAGRDAGEPAGGQGLRRRRLRARPASPTRASRSTAPRSTCRSAGTSRCGWRTSASRPRARAGR